jgi:hypothetical protein
MKAIEEASKAKDGELPTRKEVASAVRSLVDYNGGYGIYNLNYKGDPAPARVFCLQGSLPGSRQLGSEHDRHNIRCGAAQIRISAEAVTF